MQGETASLNPSLESAKGAEQPWIQSAAPRPLPRHATGAQYDEELERLIRVAAMAGLRQTPDNAVNYTTLLIGFAFCYDAASRFLQSQQTFRRESLLANRNLSPEDNSEMRFVYEATQAQLPASERLYSTSARQMLDSAEEIAKLVGRGADPSSFDGRICSPPSCSERPRTTPRT
jgi:hypothetical protein